MEELNALKNGIRALLMEHLGELSEADQVGIRQQAYELGLDNRQLSNLLQEIHVSINWSALRDEREGKDRVVRPVNIFGEEVRSLEKLAETLFEKRTQALKYLEDRVFLKENIIYLSHQNVDLAMQIMDLYTGEQDTERRFLKICYKLNPSLPFKIEGESFSTLEEIFEKGWTDYQFFMSTYNKFATGHMQIWMQYRFPDQAALLPPGDTYLHFLYFLYTFDQNYPFYIDNELFLQPSDIVSMARRDASFWPVLLTSIDEDQLSVWLELKGLGDRLTAFKSYAGKMRAEEKNSEDVSRNLVQKLLEIIGQEIEVPDISVSVEKISLLDIQAKPLFQPIVVQLNNKGFVRVRIDLNERIPGIELSQRQFSLWELEGNTSVTLNLSIDPEKLVKDHLYNLCLNISTDYQLISVPVSIKTVFPMRAFITYLLKYGLVGTVFFGIIRFLISLSHGNDGWLRPELIWDDVSAQLPPNYFAYIIIFILAILIPVMAWPKIKQIEKI